MAGVELLFGPMLIGVLLNMGLYGTMFVQMFRYYQRYTNDSAWIRYFMLYLFIVETVNVVIEVGIIYDPLIIQYGKEVAIAISPKLLPGDSILIAIVSAPIQMFTAWRISVITKSFILPGIISLLSLGSFGAGIFVSYMVHMNPEFRAFQNITTEVSVWLILSAVCDVVIAVGMTHALYTRRTGVSDVDGQINRIVRLTVETGALTAITALADVMLFLLFPRTSMNFIVDFPLSALYVCSILAMLNSRERRKPADVESAYTAPQKHSQIQNTLKTSSSFSNTFHGAKMVASTEKLGTFSDTASERTLTSHRDYYNYNSQELEGQNSKPIRLQLKPPPKTFVARERTLPERF